MATIKKSAPAASPAKDKNPALPFFDRTNYILMVAGLVLLALGFILMAGGKSTDPTQFNVKEVYGTWRITVAPILIVLGFGIEIAAIMKRPSQV